MNPAFFDGGMSTANRYFIMPQRNPKMPQKWIWDQFLGQTENSIIIATAFISHILLIKYYYIYYLDMVCMLQLFFSMKLHLQLSNNVRKTLGN